MDNNNNNNKKKKPEPPIYVSTGCSTTSPRRNDAASRRGAIVTTTRDEPPVYVSTGCSTTSPRRNDTASRRPAIVATTRDEPPVYVSTGCGTTSRRRNDTASRRPAIVATTRDVRAIGLMISNDLKKLASSCSKVQTLPPLDPHPSLFPSPALCLSSFNSIPEQDNKGQRPKISSSSHQFKTEGFGSIGGCLPPAVVSSSTSSMATTKKMNKKVSLHNLHDKTSGKPGSSKPNSTSHQHQARPNTSYCRILSSVNRESLRHPPPKTASRKEYSYEELKELVDWIHATSFKSKTTNNIHRDFSDAVLLAEVLHHHAPKLINLQSLKLYTRKNSIRGKVDNWEMLYSRVLVKLDVPSLSANAVYDIANSKPGAIEELLFLIKEKIEIYQHLLFLNAATTELIKIKSSFDLLQASTSGPSTTVSALLDSNNNNNSLEEPRTETGGWSEEGPSSASESARSRRSFVDGVIDNESVAHFGPDKKYKMLTFGDTCTACITYKLHKYDDGDEMWRTTINHVEYEGRRLVPEDISVITKDLIKIDRAVEANAKLLGRIGRLQALIRQKDDRNDDLARQIHELKLRFEETEEEDEDSRQE